MATCIGRLPVEERLCVCGDIQTERHVLQDCTLTQQIRDSHNFSTIEDIFSDTFDDDLTCKIIRQILDVYN